MGNREEYLYHPETVVLLKVNVYFHGLQIYYLLHIMSTIPLFWNYFLLKHGGYFRYLFRQLVSLELGFVSIIWFHAISCRDIVEGCLKILSGCLFFGKILPI